MMLSVMVVGAGAAFSDQSKIKNTEAVDACTALNIIGGYPDGSFKPEGNITRAEVTKMICVALNGGKNPAVSTNTTPTFSDVRNNANAAWAEGYIESCAAQGIVSGVGGGKFAPNGNVTGVQLAKMLLVSLGYKSENEGFTGNAWATNVNVRAAQKGLYAGLESMDTNAAISRDNAAQMVWNALNAYEVEYKTTLVTDSKGQLTSQITVQDKVVGKTDDKITLLEDKYETETPSGILTAVKKEDGKDTYKLTVMITNVEKDSKYTTGEKTFSGISGNYTSLLGQDVKVLVKPENNGKDATVYGVYATSKNTVVTSVKDDIDNLDKTPQNKFKVNGTEYKSDLANANDIPVFYASDISDAYDYDVSAKLISSKKDTTLGALKDYESVTLIDNNDDDKMDIAIVTPVTFAKISYLSSSTVGLNLKGGYQTNVETSYDLKDDDVVLYDKAAKDDYVILNDGQFTADGNTTITKANIVSGKVDATKGSITDVKVADTWYSVVDGTCKELKLNKNFDLAVYGNFAFACEKTAGSATLDDVLFIDKAAAITSGVGQSDGNIEAKAYFTDGSSKTITISKVNYYGTNGADLDCDADQYASISRSADVTTAFANKMWMFEMDGSDYELTLLDNSYETMSYDNYKTINSTVGLKDGKFSDNSMRVADDAVVFVKTNDEIKVVSGKTVVSWSEITANTTTKVTKAEGLTDKTNGYNYMQVGAIVLNGTNDVPGGSDYSYGYVTATPSTSKIDSTSYTTLTIWNGEKEITITGKTNDGDMKKAVKGTFVQYSTVNDQYVKVEHVKTVANAIAIEGFDKDGINGKDYADTYTVIGVDTKNISGVAGVVVDEADTTSDGRYYLNAVTFGEDGGNKGDIAAVFMANNNRIYDVNAKTYNDDTALTSSVQDMLDKTGSATITGTVKATTINALGDKMLTMDDVTVTGNKVLVNGNATISGDSKIAASGNLEVANLTLAKNAKLTLEDGMTLNVLTLNIQNGAEIAFPGNITFTAAKDFSISFADGTIGDYTFDKNGGLAGALTAVQGYAGSPNYGYGSWKF